VTLYLDTSALVKLYVAEVGSDDVRCLVEEASVVATSVVAYAEARAAFSRRTREGALTVHGLRRIKNAFDDDWPRYLALGVTEEICLEAGELAERYGLRGFDSIHLASFIEVARRAGPTTARFCGYDEPLNEAVKKAQSALVRKRRSR
jgi:uncharacterized protein